jgi:hypothetical protein
MVDLALVQSKVYYGLGKAGTVLGFQMNVYRASAALSTPIAPGNLVTTLTANIDSHAALDFTVQPKPGAFIFYFLGDPTLLLPGDYLVGQGALSDQPSTTPGQTETYFVGECGGVEPALLVRCNATINMLRQPGESAFGNVGYMGDIKPNEVPLMTGWPASVLRTGRAAAGATKLAGDVDMPWFDILLPFYPGVELTQADIAVDQTGRRFRVSAAEQTQSGWRLRAIVTMT